MFDVVVDVARYREFVPWCIRSEIIKPIYPNMFKAHMEIGFQVVKEQYIALVTYQKPKLVKVKLRNFENVSLEYRLLFQSVCTDGRLFSHLITEWRFLPSNDKEPRSCILDFAVSESFVDDRVSSLESLGFIRISIDTPREISSCVLR